MENLQLQIIPMTIGNLGKVEVMGLSDNILVRLPRYILEHRYLKVIYLDNNPSLGPELQRLIAEVHESGSLLPCLVYISLSACGLTEIPTGLYSCSQLATMYLQHNNISYITSDIQKLQNLEWLNLADNNLTNVPVQLFSFKNLKMLCLTNSPKLGVQMQQILRQVDVTKPLLPHLEYLWCTRCGLEYIPPVLFSCMNMLQLILDKNMIRKVPDDIGKLQLLETFDVATNDITEISLELFSCKKLKVLNLHKNTQLGPELQRVLNHVSVPKPLLPDLQALTCANIALTRIPIPLLSCEQLQLLNIAGNTISNIPSQIGRLRRLGSLLIAGNNIHSLPDELFCCKQIQELSMENNGLRHISKDIGNLKMLRRLDVGDNKLQSIPIELFSCRMLKELAMCNNQLLGPQLQQLLTCIDGADPLCPHLKVVTCSNCGLTEIPLVFLLCTQLARLDLYNNHLSGIPRDIRNLKSLKELYLYDNDIQYTDSGLFDCKQLEILALQNNPGMGPQFQSMCELIEESISLLPRLHVLMMANCGLTTLPPLVTRFMALRTLIVRGNHLTHLPIAMCGLKTLEILDADDNCLTKVPLDLLQCPSLQSLSLNSNTSLAPSLLQFLQGLASTKGALPNVTTIQCRNCGTMREVPLVMKRGKAVRIVTRAARPLPSWLSVPDQLTEKHVGEIVRGLVQAARKYFQSVQATA